MLAGLGAPGYSGLHRFDDVDATGEEATFAHFLERVEGQPDVVARWRRSYELLALRAGDLVADVGCGLGTATRELAALGVRVIGFDASEAMLAEARRRSTETGVEFVQADVTALPLADGALAGYRAERLYQHLAEPSVALRFVAVARRSASRSPSSASGREPPVEGLSRICSSRSACRRRCGRGIHTSSRAGSSSASRSRGRSRRIRVSSFSMRS